MTKQTLTKGRIGGSSAAAACGLSPYTTPLQLYDRLTGAERKPFRGNRFTEWGNRLEAACLAKYQDDHGGYFIKVPDKSIDHANGWARATPDGLVQSRDDKWYGLELKTAGFDHGRRWGSTQMKKMGHGNANANLEEGRVWGASRSGKYPIEYKVQCHWYMWICDLPYWDLCVLIGGNDWREYRLERDPAFESLVTEKARQFWYNNVKAKHPPCRVELDDRLETYTEHDIDQLIAKVSAFDMGCHQLGIESNKIKTELAQAMSESQARVDSLDVIEALT